MDTSPHNVTWHPFTFEETEWPKDYSQAASWFRTAAEHGFAPAQENLAWMYYTGSGLSRDHTEAAKWVRRAAERGSPSAQLDLG